MNDKGIDDSEVRSLSTLVAAEHNLSAEQDSMHTLRKGAHLIELNSIKQQDPNSGHAYNIMFQLDYKPLFLHPFSSNCIYLFNKDNLMLWPS